MSYQAGEQLILDTLRVLPEYTAENSARVNWLLLNTGKGGFYAILKPGESTEEIMGLGHGSVHISQQTIIEVWRLYQGVADAVSLESEVETIKAHFRTYPHIGGGASSLYLDARVAGSSPMALKWLSEGGARWVEQDIIISWLEQQNITLAE